MQLCRWNIPGFIHTSEKHGRHTELHADLLSPGFPGQYNASGYNNFFGRILLVY